MLQFGGLESIEMRSLWHMDSMVRSGVALGAALLLLAAVVAVVALAAGRRGWLVGVAAVLAALGLHLQIGLLQRAERIGLSKALSVSYGIGGILAVGGAFVALVSFIAVLAKRH